MAVECWSNEIVIGDGYEALEHPSVLPGCRRVGGFMAESLLAQKVLQGNTGYRNHPQLIRFQQVSRPEAAIAAYLTGCGMRPIGGTGLIRPGLARRDFTILYRLNRVSWSTSCAGWLINCRLAVPTSTRFYFRLNRSNLIPFHPVPGGIEAWERRCCRVSFPIECNPIE